MVSKHYGLVRWGLVGGLLAVGAFVLKSMAFGGGIPNGGVGHGPSNLDFDAGGTVLVTDARGVGRDVALALARQGVHVLAGVPTERDKALYTFDINKGVEPMVLDMQQPRDIVEALYRARELIRDLGRPLIGIVLNTMYLDVSDDPYAAHRKKAGPVVTSTQDSRERPSYFSGLDINFDLSVAEYDRVLRIATKCFVRLLDATMHMWQEPVPHPGRVVLLGPAEHHIVVPHVDVNDFTQPRPSKGQRLLRVARRALDEYAAQLPGSLAVRGVDVQVSTVLAAPVGAVAAEESPSSGTGGTFWVLGDDEHDGAVTDGSNEIRATTVATSQRQVVKAVVDSFLANAPTGSTVAAGTFRGTLHIGGLLSTQVSVSAAALVTWARVASAVPILGKVLHVGVVHEREGPTSSNSPAALPALAVLQLELQELYE